MVWMKLHLVGLHGRMQDSSLQYHFFFFVPPGDNRPCNPLPGRLSGTCYIRHHHHAACMLFDDTARYILDLLLLYFVHSMLFLFKSLSFSFFVCCRFVNVYDIAVAFGLVPTTNKRKRRTRHATPLAHVCDSETTPPPPSLALSLALSSLALSLSFSLFSPPPSLCWHYGLCSQIDGGTTTKKINRQALEEMENTAARLERMFRRLHVRLDAVSPGDVSFS